MKYVSTRGQSKPLSFSEALSEGLAPDGGLFVPQTMPDISKLLPSWEGLSYPELCFEFLKIFATDIPAADLKKIVDSSYNRFDDPAIAPLAELRKDLYLLELYHGPTLAFKDFALQLLGNLYEYLLKKSGHKINVLGATSGDTGSAAISGLIGKENVNIFILYPFGRVSPLQERQMTCTGASNVFPIAIDGTFDDAQHIVKEIFADTAFKAEWNLSAVNSINLARILAQCVYYIYAYLKLPHSKRGNLQFIVPTGNFGNVLAGWMVSQMGVGGLHFKVATNQNDILYRLFETGIYELGKVEPSYAPSMDIQVASNFERFIYFMQNCDPETVRKIMAAFKSTGRWVFDNFDAGAFSASRADDSEIPAIIKDVYENCGAVIDPHTACGFKDLGFEGAKIVLSTAHPAKFPELIHKTLGLDAKSPILEELKSKPVERVRLGADLHSLRDYITKHGIKDAK